MTRKDNIAFSKKVFTIVRQIPSGNVLSYKDVSMMAGRSRAYRAVGNILKKNYDPKIPCHRVIKTDGNFGGYNRGAATKRRMLLAEKKHVRLGRVFYTRNTIDVAKDLLGKYIVRKVGKKEIAGKITEVEVYIGPQDRASHAYGGKVTNRNVAEYMIGGHIYIYLVYGMYWQLNISTSVKNKPECVLVRALDVGNPRLAGGPGKVCRYLKLDKSFYGEDVVRSKRIWLEDCGERVEPRKIRSSARIGIDYAGPYWSRRKWRFFLKVK